jgi:corrinoid protein of di/trimethylamine methyltransferase
MSQLYDEMMRSVLEGDEELARQLAQDSLAQNMDLKLVMSEGFLKGIQEAGVLYEEGEYFLPDLVCSADAMKSALAILDEEIKKPSSGLVSRGKVLLATAEGDVHDIGKTIVGAMLTAAGYEVTDLGPDVPNETILAKAIELQADVIGLSALLTTTMEEQGKLIQLLQQSNQRENFKCIVGGAPVTHSWSEKIMADGYSDDAIGAVGLVNSLIV